MYATSEGYKNAIKNQYIADSISGEITLKDGSSVTITDKNLVSGSLRIIHELCNDYKIGTFNLGVMRIGLHDDSALLRDFSGAQIKISYNIETADGVETIPMGIFIADGATVKRRRTTINMTAYDYGILFDSAVSTSVRAMTGTAEELIRTACEKCGVAFDGIDDSLPNKSIQVSPSSKQIQSYRDLIGWCAALLCGYAVIDREGKLKIISSRYKVAEDNKTILENKKLTSAERMSIYSTDTRAWISEISAYSGDNQKIYKTDVSLSDEQAARAVYYLEKNPLLEGKSETECDEINNAWLYFIDTFMQRGITAEIYGDPSIDVGDVIRCSEGDIDQRKSVVGLITKQEWRYRNFHTIVTASPQLSDGFPEKEESSDVSGSEENETETESEELLSPLKVISQVEKRIDRLNSLGGDGVGVFVNSWKNAERFNDYSESGLAKTAGEWSHAEGRDTEAGGDDSHAEGKGTKATSYQCHAEGDSTEASGWAAHSEGCSTKASGQYSHSEGYDTAAGGLGSHSEGYETTVESGARGSHAEGHGTKVIGTDGSHAEGYKTTAVGASSHSEGSETTAVGGCSHSEGRDTVAGSDNAHAEGCSTRATGLNSHSEGYGAQASGYSSHAEGYGTKASGYGSHAEGEDTIASGSYSHAGGKGTIADATAQTSIGTYNEADETALFLVGCGTSDSDRKNALRLDNEGNLHVSGNITADGSVGDKYLSGEGVSIDATETAHEYIVNLVPATGAELGGVKVGRGLEVGGDGTLSSTEIYSAGEGIAISESKKIELNIASGSELGGIIVGDGLEIDEKGKLNVTAQGGGGSGKAYAAGTGIAIIEGDGSNTIAVNIDNETITVEDGKLKANGLTIENAVVIKEAESSYFLHKYTEIEYLDGNKVCYGSGINSIIVCGCTMCKRYGSSPYNTTKAVFGRGGRSASDMTSNFAVELDVVSTNYEGNSNVRIKFGGGTSYGSIYGTADLSKTWIGMDWDTIYGPSAEHPYGYAYIRSILMCCDSSGVTGWREVQMFFADFASLAEYNAAIRLTYEPQTLTMVNETITEV